MFVGGAGKFLSVSERISPKLVDIQQRMKGFDDQKTDWPVAADAPNNLYAPVAYDGGVNGDFLRQSHHRSMYQSIAANVVASSLIGAGVLALSARAARRGTGDGAWRVLLSAGAAALAGKALLAAFYEE